MSTIDYVTDAQQKLHYQCKSSVFFKASLANGFGPRADDVADKFHSEYMSNVAVHGYADAFEKLPLWLRSWLIVTCVEEA